VEDLTQSVEAFARPQYSLDKTSLSGSTFPFHQISSETHFALVDHLVQGGMDTQRAEQTLRYISPDLLDALSSHAYGSPDRLTFHDDGAVAVSIEHGGASDGRLSVSMDTLHDVQVRGVPYAGLDAARDGLGQEAAHLSDLALADTFGHASLERLGASGFPHGAVHDVQQVLQQHVDVSGGLANVTQSEALQAYLVANESGQTASLMVDNGSGHEVAVSLEAVRAAMQPTQSAPLPHEAAQEYQRVLSR
jgi:hypothetical protein